MLKKSLQRGLEDRLFISQIRVTVPLERKSDSLSHLQKWCFKYSFRRHLETWDSKCTRAFCGCTSESLFCPFFPCKFPEKWIVTYFVSILPSYMLFEDFPDTDPITAVSDLGHISSLYPSVHFTLNIGLILLPSVELKRELIVLVLVNASCTLLINYRSKTLAVEGQWASYNYVGISCAASGIHLVWSLIGNHRHFFFFFVILFVEDS